MQNKQLYGVMIPRIELLELTSGITKEISTHSLGQWLKAQTKGEYVVLPRSFVVALMEVVLTFSDAEQAKAICTRWDFDEIRRGWL